ncbi:MAG TPA: response regulator transcription factor [Thermomicrobiales bacterium]
MRTRAVLVAQSPVLRIGIQGVLESTGDYAVVAEAENCLQATSAAIAHQPDVVLIQDALRGVAGIIAARAVREFAPRAAILVLTEDFSDRRVEAALRHGVDALLPAEIEGSALIAAIRRTIAGARPLLELARLRPSVVERIRDTAQASEPVAEAENGNKHPLLSGYEIAILDGLIRGIPSHEIAAHLRLVEQAIAEHGKSLLRKLRAADREEAVASAARTGMMDISAQLPTVPSGATSLA